MNIIDFIPVGRENAISNDDLAIEKGTDKRNARWLVYQARVNGEPICSVCCGGKCGYYIPKDLDEARIYLRQQRSRLKRSRAALNGVVKFVREAERSEKNGK